MISKDTISLEEAKKLANIVVDLAIRDGQSPIVVAVLDNSGRMLAWEKSGNAALPISDTWAPKKAYTAYCFGTSTEELQAEKLTLEPEFCGCSGGILIPAEENSRKIVGYMGISGRIPSDTIDDHTLALKALKKFFLQ